MIRKVITKDDSVSYYNSEFDEHYHSMSGAEEEAIKKHAEPANLAEYAKKGHVTILDVCFGLGYNSAAAIDMIWKINPDCTIYIAALESDMKIIDETKNLDPSFKQYDLIRQIAEKSVVKSGGIEMELYLGDAAEKITEIDHQFDVVFHDPFSPKKCPSLWTVNFFKEIYLRMNPGGVLTTYSCARVVRDNLKTAGFEVGDGPCIGRRAPSTIAHKR